MIYQGMKKFSEREVIVDARLWQLAVNNTAALFEKTKM